MNKWKALALGLVFLVAGVYALPTDGNFFGWILLFVAFGYLGIAGYKIDRDWSIISDAQTKRVAAAEKPKALPPMTSPGSKRLFVPPALKEK